MTAPDTAPPPEIVDSHRHLDFPDFAGELEAVIARAAAAGVTRIVTIGTRLADAGRVRAIAEAHRGVFYTVGTHPMNAAAEPMVHLEELVALAREPKLVGIGESGLDYHYTPESRGLQQQSLRLHIAAARATGLPLVIHARDADVDMARILTEEHAAGRFEAVMHCYSSGPALAETALGLGFYLSMSGIAAFPKSDALRAIFAAAPVDRILVETDAPYLAPPPFRGRRNEPAHVVHTARAGAVLFGMDYAAFAARTSANFDRLFSRATRARRAA